MRNQDKIDVGERSDFFLGSFENRIRQPRIDEQNLSSGSHDSESRLAIPSELRFHATQKGQKTWSSKGNDPAPISKARMTNDEGMSKSDWQKTNVRTLTSGFVISSSFDIRDSSF